MYHWPIMRNNLLYRCIDFAFNLFVKNYIAHQKLIALGNSVINMKTISILQIFFCSSFTMMNLLGFNL